MTHFETSSTNFIAIVKKILNYILWLFFWFLFFLFGGAVQGFLTGLVTSWMNHVTQGIPASNKKFHLLGRAMRNEERPWILEFAGRNVYCFLNNKNVELQTIKMWADWNTEISIKNMNWYYRMKIRFNCFYVSMLKAKCVNRKSFQLNSSIFL